MIQALTDECDLAKLFQILEQVRIESVRVGFYEIFFTELLPVRRLLYPCDYELETEVILALEQAMRRVGDAGCYVDLLSQSRYIDREGRLVTTPSRYCYVSVEQFRYAIDENGLARELKDRDKPFIFVDHWSMYSVQKNWGIHVDGDGKYALLAGTEAFMNAFDAECIPFLLSVQDFLNEWKDECRCDKENLEADWNWLTRLMIHVYGKKEAFQLMDGAGMFK